MSEGVSSIQRGSRKGRISGTAIALIVVVILVAAGVGAYIVFAPGTPPEIVRIDGSSTVAPITSAWAGEFNNPSRQVTVAISGTGGGFAKFCSAVASERTDLSDASRRIKTSERDLCTSNGIEGIVEFKIGYDALSIIVSKRPGFENDWVANLTIEQLCRIWTSNTSAGACGGAGPKVNAWNELDAAWPAQPIELFGPGTASGTFDYFIEAVLAPTGDTPIRSDFIGSEDDNVIINGVYNEQYGLGYLGYAYVVENTDKVRAVPVDGGAGPVAPSEATVKAGTYPLARPLFVYGATSHPEGRSLSRAVVKDFLRFGFTARGTELLAATGYVGLTPAEIAIEVAKIPA